MARIYHADAAGARINFPPNGELVEFDEDGLSGEVEDETADAVEAHFHQFSVRRDAPAEDAPADESADAKDELAGVDKDDESIAPDESQDSDGEPEPAEPADDTADSADAQKVKRRRRGGSQLPD